MTLERLDRSGRAAAERAAQHQAYDGSDIGWLMVLDAQDHVELEHLYLRPETQGRGIGTRIIQDLVAEARKGGREIRLSTARINPARRLYERLGFRVVDEDRYKVYMVLTTRCDETRLWK